MSHNIFTRRRALQAFSAIMGAAAVGCSKEEEGDDTTEGDELNLCLGGMDAARREFGGPVQMHKYEKFVVLMMENRSFDHYFGHLSMPANAAEGIGGKEKWDGRTPDPNGKKVDGL